MTGAPPQGPVDAYFDALAPEPRATMDRLRALVRAARPDVTEQIKWNAPSFALDGEDRITFGLTPKGNVRVVVHRGAKAKETAGFSFADPDRLATWPAVDRGVLSFRDGDAVTGNASAITDFFRRWLDTTT